MGLSQYSIPSLEVGPLLGGLSHLVLELELPWLTPTSQALSPFASKSKWVFTKWTKKIKFCLMNQWERKRSGEKVKESKKAEREKPMGLMEAKERDSRKRMFRERERERFYGRKNCTLPPTKLRSLCVSVCRVKTLSLSLSLSRSAFWFIQKFRWAFFHNSQNCPLRNCQTECYRCLTVSH